MTRGARGSIPADEIDGDEVVIVSEYDPFGWGFGLTSRGPGHGANAPPGLSATKWSAMPIWRTPVCHPGADRGAHRPLGADLHREAHEWQRKAAGWHCNHRSIGKISLAFKKHNIVW